MHRIPLKWGLRASLACVLIGGLALMTACGHPGPEPFLDRINLARVEPETVIPGTTLHFIGSGFLPDEVIDAHFVGHYAGASVDGHLPLTYQSTTDQTLVAEAQLFTLLGGPTGTFDGEVTLSVTRDGKLIEDTNAAAFAVMPTLTPQLLQLDSAALAFMESISVTGRGFLLPGEGKTHFRFTGTFTPKGGSALPLDGVELQVEVSTRSDASYTHSPAALGLSSGTLEGNLAVENSHLSGELVAGGSIPLLLTILEPAIASASPTAASRGQVIDFLGRGFLPADASHQQTSSLLFEGSFTTADGTVLDLGGANALELFPSYEGAGLMRYIIRPERDARGKLTGLGSTPGTLSGNARIHLRYEGTELLGPPWAGNFRILATKQVVFIKYLDSFSDGLQRFGLRNVETELREHVLEICQRDYAAYNVEFRDKRPTDFVDYSVIEVSAIDPNGAGLFGLDNTEGKDTGNVRLNDVVGGRNAESEEQGTYAFGGVFVESFISFSPKAENPSPMATDRFDRIFGGIVPELGGKEVVAGEFPGGSRDSEIAEAIRVMGNLIGNTLVHEIGHSLGMAAIPSGFHHDGSTPGLIMNPGSARPFEERAELDGQGPAVWGKIDGDYMSRILPRG